MFLPLEYKFPLFSLEVVGSTPSMNICDSVEKITVQYTAAFTRY